MIPALISIVVPIVVVLVLFWLLTKPDRRSGGATVGKSGAALQRPASAGVDDSAAPDYVLDGMGGAGSADDCGSGDGGGGDGGGGGGCD